MVMDRNEGRGEAWRGPEFWCLDDGAALSRKHSANFDCGNCLRSAVATAKGDARHVDGTRAVSFHVSGSLPYLVASR
jgi:hypothetical protein